MIFALSFMNLIAGISVIFLVAAGIIEFIRIMYDLILLSWEKFSTPSPSDEIT